MKYSGRIVSYERSGRSGGKLTVQNERGEWKLFTNEDPPDGATSITFDAEKRKSQAGRDFWLVTAMAAIQDQAPSQGGGGSSTSSSSTGSSSFDIFITGCMQQALRGGMPYDQCTLLAAQLRLAWQTAHEEFEVKKDTGPDLDDDIPF